MPKVIYGGAWLSTLSEPIEAAPRVPAGTPAELAP